MLRELEQHIKYLAGEIEGGLRDTIVEAMARNAADRVLGLDWREKSLDEREGLAKVLIERYDREGQLAFMWLKYTNFCEVMSERNKGEERHLEIPDFFEYRAHMRPYQRELLKPQR